MSIGVVGLGYVGLPLAVELAKAGFHTTGIDLDARKIRAIMDGESYIPDVPSADVRGLRKAGTLDATTDFSVVKELDTINICVPTPLTKYREPDLQFIVKTGQEIAPNLRKGQLVVLESSTYPGTTREDLKPILEAAGELADHQGQVGEDHGHQDHGHRLGAQRVQVDLLA